MKKTANNILLLCANNQALLSIARSLSKKGFCIDVADWQNLSVKHSRYINNYYRLSDIELNADAFVNDLCKLIETNNYLFLLPVNDVALEICVKYRSTLEGKISIVASPSDETYDYSHNKYLLLKKCEELAFSIPAYFYIENLAVLDKIAKNIKYPVIAKPVFSKLIKDKKLYQFSVKKVFFENELYDFIREIILNVPVLLEEYIEGYGAGYNVLAKEGVIVAAYQHERITEPIGGGASSYRKTTEINKYGLKDCSEKLINSIKWTGPAMIEYRIADGIPYIMEINGRFWGSMELALLTGIDYPALLIDSLYYNKDLLYKENNKIVYARNFKMDLRYALLKCIYYKNPLYILKFVKSLLHSFRADEIIEDSLFRDFKLELYNYYSLIGKVFLLIYHKIKPTFIAFRKDKPVLQKGAKIGFLCYGNICRSPFAEFYAKKHYGSDYSFYSFGSIKQENRLSPVNAVAAASDFGIDLNLHISKFISLEQAENMDVIFIMDKFNYSRFKKLYPQFIDKVFYLDNKAEIKDPFRGNINIFKNIYKVIAERIDLLFINVAK